MNALLRSENVVNKVLRLGPSFGRPAILPKSETVVLDYSSVNIGKPIHAGHLRATLTGHFVRRINEFMGHKVIGINYLGDWGTQFGFLIHGYRKYGDSRKLKKNKAKHLFEVYVRACTEHTYDAKEKSRMNRYTIAMENGDEKLLDLWKTFRTISIEELERTYRRMNVDFAEYQYESQFVEEAKSLVEDMVQKNLAWPEDGAIVCEGHINQPVTLLTRQGATLYMTRDLAAALHRAEKFNFDRMHYIVNEGQTMHFQNLSHILSKLGHNWIDRCEPWGMHIRFGTVQSLKTRKGEVVFLGDILNILQDRMLKRLDGNTRLTDESEISAVADQLGWSFLVESLLKHPRLKPVNQDFYNMEEGVKLQYSHARLCSLEAAALDKGLKPYWDNEHCMTLMSDPIIDRFLLHLLKMEEVVENGYISLEPKELLTYAQKASKIVSKLLKIHPVISCDDKKIAEGRFAVFMAARQVIRTCFHLVGIQAIDKM